MLLVLALLVWVEDLRGWRICMGSMLVWMAEWRACAESVLAWLTWVDGVLACVTRVGWVARLRG